MIKVLDASKSLTALVSDTTNGLGQLTVMNDSVTEELNGIYELEFDIATTDKHYEDLKSNLLVKVNVDETGDEQIFRVYYVSEPINFVSHVKCQHITYDLNKIVVRPFTATGASAAKDGMNNNKLGSYPFTMTTDISNTTSKFTLDIPRSFRECLGGYEGSLLDTFRGEYKWDNLTVQMLAHRGSDHGTRIAYGKNLTDFQQEVNNESVYDAVYGYAVVDEHTYEASSIYNKTGATSPKVMAVDFSSNYDTGQTPTAAQLLSYATSYANNNDIEVPNVNIKVSFVPLWQTEEYKDIAPLERVFLGDTVHVYFDKLNVEASARVIKTVWSPSLGRYTEIELGSAKANLNTVINETVDNAFGKVAQDTGFIESKMELLSDLVVNGLGLHISQDSAGRIVLHNKETIADSNVQYMITDQGFVVSTDYGTTWNAGFDTSGNAVLNSLATITLEALEIYGSTINGTIINGSTINFGDMNNKHMSATNTNVGVSFTGNGNYDVSTIGDIDIQNTDGNNRKNTIAMTKNSNGTYFNLINWIRDNIGENNRANWFLMHSTDSANEASIQTYDDSNNSQAEVELYYNKSTLTPSVFLGVRSGNSYYSSIRLSTDGISIYSDGDVTVNGKSIK